MIRKAVEWLLVKVQRDADGNSSQVSVQKVDGNNAAIQELAQGHANEFVIDDAHARSIAVVPASALTPAAAPVAPAAMAVPAAPAETAAPAAGSPAWAAMPGGWATLAAAEAPAIAVHGAYPLDDGIARVVAGGIIPVAAGLSYTGMPGGWANLVGTAAAQTAATPSASAMSNDHDATAATAAPVAPITPAVAQNNNSAGSPAWSAMPGGWATLAAAGVPALANHGVYPFHDGVARVAAGKIIPAVAGLSCTGMPGGWAKLSATDSAPANAAPAQAIYSNGHDATATTAPTDVAATQIAAAPVAAQNDNSTAQLAWASMPGGWATLAAAGLTALAAHGAYPLHDGIERVTAGEIIHTAAGLSYTEMPGGWASMGG